MDKGSMRGVESWEAKIFKTVWACLVLDRRQLRLRGFQPFLLVATKKASDADETKRAASRKW